MRCVIEDGAGVHLPRIVAVRANDAFHSPRDDYRLKDTEGELRARPPPHQIFAAGPCRADRSS